MYSIQYCCSHKTELKEISSLAMMSYIIEAHRCTYALNMIGQTRVSELTKRSQLLIVRELHPFASGNTTHYQVATSTHFHSKCKPV